MEIAAVREFTFEAAHYLPNHPGKCSSMHGHSYRLQVGFRGMPNDTTGMVVDFGDIEKVVNERIVKLLDHKILNEVKKHEFPCQCPTAERMVEWIVRELYDTFRNAILCLVRLYETPTSYVEWRG